MLAWKEVLAITRISKTPEERRKEIIETAFEVFMEKGYDHTTIQDIAERMNIAQGLCYRYFKSKHEIFEATADYYAQQTVVFMTAGVDESSGAVERLDTVLKNVLLFAMEHGEYEAAYLQDLQMRSERIHRVTMHIADVIIPIVRQGREEGVFHCDDVENTVRFVAFGVVDMLHHDINKENARECFRSRIPTVINICKNVLRAPDIKLGVGWGIE